MWQTEINNYGSCFALLPTLPTPPLKPKKSEFWKNEKNCWQYHHFAHVHQKPHLYEVIIQYSMEWDRHNCLSFWAIFCPFTSLRTQKNKILKKWKKHLDMSSFYTCIKNHNHRMYASWDMDCDRHNFLYHFESFFALLPHYWPQRLRFEKNAQNILFHMCTINEDHMMYDSWDIRHDSQSFLSFWTIFCPLTLLTTWKIKILKKWKKHLGILSFYNWVSQITIMWYTAP